MPKSHYLFFDINASDSHRWCLHFWGFLLYLIIQIVHLIVFIHKLFQFRYVLLIKFNFTSHVLQIAAVSLQFTFPSMFLHWRLRLNFLFMSFEVCKLSFKNIWHFTILIFDHRRSLLLLPILLLKLLLEVNCVHNELTLCFFFWTCNFGLTLSDLLPHRKILSPNAL